MRIQRYTNPIVPGYHADPSIARVGGDYYLVASTCEFFPGVPLFHSHDLVHWRQLGHVLTRESQLPLRDIIPSRGIYAPTLRYHDGAFYVITTNVSFRQFSDRPTGNFFVTSRDPSGPWSEPVWIAGQGGIDPDLFWDANGTVFLTTTGGTPGEWKAPGAYQSVIDLSSGELRTKPRLVWRGTGGRYPESPHIYRINGRYYLLMAEGGTEYGHMITVARSDAPGGPFEPCPRNPIFTHRDAHFDDQPIHGTGHGDLVQDHEGNWWIVFLAFRTAGGNFHHLGREVFLAPVRWDDDGWPVINDNKPVTEEMVVEGLPAQPFPAPPIRTTFDRALGPEWSYLRNPTPAAYSLDDRRGWLALRGEAFGLEAASSPAWVGRRQQHFRVRATTLLDFEPREPGDEAGLTAYRDHLHHFEIGLRRSTAGREVFFRQTVGPTLSVVTGVAPAPEGSVRLRLAATAERYSFSFAAAEGEGWQTLGEAPTRFLSSEVAGGFTGAFFALYAAGHGHPLGAPAYFNWFDYEPQP